MGSERDRHPTPEGAPRQGGRQKRLERQRTRTRRRIIAVSAVVVVVIAVVVAVAMSGGGGEAQPKPFAGTTVEVSLSDFAITGKLIAPAGLVRLHAVNQGATV